MSEPTVQPALDQAMKEVLERMFFLEAETVSPPEGLDSALAVEARLAFAGSPPGALCLRVTAAAAGAISADFLGIDESEVSARQVEEVICELANMICGSVLSRVESSATFRLGAPEIVSGPGPDFEPANATVHSVETASGVFTAILTTESSACLSGEEFAF